MLDKLFKNTTRPIGLDIGHSSIKMIQLSGDGRSVRVVAAQQASLDPALHLEPSAKRDLIVSSIREMLNRGDFQGRQVVSCLGSDKVKIKSLRLDTAEPEQIEQMMVTEVAQRFELNPAVDELRYMIAGNVFQGEQIKNEVIFFGIDRVQLSEHLSTLESAGLVPTAIDTVPCALFRSFQAALRRREDCELVSVFVDLGSHFTTVIIGKGQQIVFVKQIPIAGEHLTAEVASRLGVSTDDATLLRSRLRGPDGQDEQTSRSVMDAMSGTIETLAREISLCFRYYAVTFRGQRPAEAVFTGGEAYESSLIDALRRHLGVAIRIAEPLRGFDLSGADFDRRRNPQLCEWAVAVGAGLKGWDIPDIRTHEETPVSVEAPV